MFIIVFYGLYSVLNAIYSTAEHVHLILEGMKMVYRAVSANKQAVAGFWMRIFLCFMHDELNSLARVQGQTAKAPTGLPEGSRPRSATGRDGPRLSCVLERGSRLCLRICLYVYLPNGKSERPAG